MDQVFEFFWTVPESGYHWIDARVFVNDGGAKPSSMRHDSRLEDKPRRVLTDGLAIGTRYMMKRYTPLMLHTGLFRTFADTPMTEEGIKAFADKYGALGVRRPLNIERQECPGQLLGLWGETFQDWVHQIDEMRRSIEIWDLVRTGNKRGLSHYIRWSNAEYAADGRTVTRADGWYYDDHPNLPSPFVDPHRGAPAPAGRHTQRIGGIQDGFKEDEVIMPAMFLAQRWINDHLEGRVSPRVVYHLERGKQVLKFVPQDLCGAMWLQFAQAIDGDKKYQACKECGKWFEVSLDAFRTNRLFCSDACKSKDYRNRKDRARKMRSEGMSPKEIAKTLNANLETVKKWVGKAK